MKINLDVIGAGISGYIGLVMLGALIQRMIGLPWTPAYGTTGLVVICILSLSLTCIFLFRLSRRKKES